MHVRTYQTQGLETDQEKAPVFRKIFDLFIRGGDVENIAKTTGLTRRRIE